MKMQDIKTPEEMLDYIIEHIKTSRHIYKKGEKKYSFYTELIEDLELLKEGYENRYVLDMSLKVTALEHDGENVTGLIANNGFVLRVLDEDGNPLTFNEEFINRLKKE